MEKSFTTYVSRGYEHTVYELYGIRKNGKKATCFCNKQQWDKFDVPIKERKPRSKSEIKSEHKSKLEIISYSKDAKKRSVRKRKVYNEEIEKWLLEHNDIDFQKLIDKDMFQ